jgi:transposase-like protein
MACGTELIERYNAEHESAIELRQIKYLNNIIEQEVLSQMPAPYFG